MSIEVINLSHIYNPDTAFMKKAVDNISLNIEDGSFTAVIGHTGSGKSTLIQHFNALVRPTSGTVLLDGFDINSDKSRLKEIRRRVGLVFQYPEHQLFEVTVAADVGFGPKNMGLEKEEIDDRVRGSLDIVGIPEEMRETSPFELSGGQKRRVAIAGVLAMRPDVLILDEPTAGLDPRGKNEILDNICRMRERLGITVVLVSHSMEDVARLAEKIIVLHNGRVALTGTPAEVFAQYETLEKIGLAAPQITYLAARLKQNGFKISDGIFTVEEAVAEIYKNLTS